MIVFWDFQLSLIYLAKYLLSFLNSPNLIFNGFRQKQCKQNTLISFISFTKKWDYDGYRDNGYFIS